MSVPTFTKTGAKATTSAKLAKDVFEVTAENHELLKQAYLAYLANGRDNLAITKTRGLIQGGGRKPHKQKGTGRARAGSIRSPIWRGGGVIFGPTGSENYTIRLNTKAKRLAVRQALTLQSDKIKVIEDFDTQTGKVKTSVELLNKIGATRKVLLVVDIKDSLTERATRNISDVKVVQAKYLNTYDVLNAHNIVITKKALDIVHEWLGGVI